MPQSSTNNPQRVERQVDPDKQSPRETQRADRSQMWSDWAAGREQQS